VHFSVILFETLICAYSSDVPSCSCVCVWFKSVNRKLPVDPSAPTCFGCLCSESPGTCIMFEILKEMNALRAAVGLQKFVVA